MVRKCDLGDRVACDIRDYFESRFPGGLPGGVKVDSAPTRTDLRDPAHPVSRFINPKGQFTGTRGDGIATALEYRGAFVSLTELAASSWRGEDLNCAARRYGEGDWRGELLCKAKDVGIRVPWLPTDPSIFPEVDSDSARAFALKYVQAADAIWDETVGISDPAERRRQYARLLYDRMSSEAQDGFGITFYDPELSPAIQKRDHPFYSDLLNCVGVMLYGMMCERHGVKTTPVRRLTDEDGNTIYHILAGINFSGSDIDPTKPDQWTLVSFHPKEKGYDLKLTGKSTASPVSRLENLAYIHITRAATIFADDREKQREELGAAYGYAPHSDSVNYQIAAWHYNSGNVGMAVKFLQRTLRFSPNYQSAIDLKRDIMAQGRSKRRSSAILVSVK